MSADGPADPVTMLAGGCAQVHEVYESFIAAGFSRKQAFKLVVVQWREIVRSGLGAS